MSDNAKTLPSMTVSGWSHLKQSVGGSLAFRSRLINITPTSVFSRSTAAFLGVRLFSSGNPMLRLPVSSEAIRVGKLFPTYLTGEELVPPAFMNHLVMSSKLEVMTVGLPAYSTGVKSRLWRRLRLRWGRRLWLRVGVLRLDVLRVWVVGRSGWGWVLAPVLCHATLSIWVKAVEGLWSWCCGYLFQLSFLVEFAVPPKALGVTKFFPTDCAFVILCTRVDCLMLAEMKRLSEIFSTYGAMMRLFTSVDAVMSA